MIYKRGKGKVYWYKFMWQGRLIRESTRQGNDKVGRQMEAAHRTALAKGLVGIRDPKPVSTLAEFARERFLPWARATFEQSSPKSWAWYRFGTRALTSFAGLANRRLSEITGEQVADFAAHRLSMGLQVSTVNSSLRVLRRMLRLAVEWGQLDHAPKIKLLPGERHRERVVTPEEEAKYLAAAPEPLASLATVLVDTGTRPEECFRLRWEAITWTNGRHGTLLVTHGKTTAARRVVPFTSRVRAVLEERWEAQGKPTEGWVWPSGTRSGHIECTVKKQHRKALRLSGVRPLVLYSLRHTFLTRLGESGCDTWTLARIAGHSSVAISSRYVHPSEEAVLAAVERLGGHNSRHSRRQQVGEPTAEKLLSA